MTRRFARRIIEAFTAWRHARRVKRAVPVAADLKREIAEAKRQHRNTAGLRRRLHNEIKARLEFEQGRQLSERTTA